MILVWAVLQSVLFPTKVDLVRRDLPLAPIDPLLSLTPLLDQNSLLRVGCRLDETELDNYSKLVILRATVWIIRAKIIIKSVNFHYVVCGKIKAAVAHR